MKEVLQTGFIQTSSPASYSEKTSGGQNVGSLVFGVFQLATFSGEVFNDCNGNGTLDGGESGIAGWTVKLLNSSNAVVATTTTDSSGNYSFTGVGPGSYTIQEVQQSGYTPTTATSIAVTATSGLNSTGNNFGEFQISTLSGEVYNDLNGNGTIDSGEPGLSGWTINLLEQLQSGRRLHHHRFPWRLHVHRQQPRHLHGRGSAPAGVCPDAPPPRAPTPRRLVSGQSVANLNFGDFQTDHVQRRGVQRLQRQRRARWR